MRIYLLACTSAQLPFARGSWPVTTLVILPVRLIVCLLFLFPRLQSCQAECMLQANTRNRGCPRPPQDQTNLNKKNTDQCAPTRTIKHRKTKVLSYSSRLAAFPPCRPACLLCLSAFPPSLSCPALLLPTPHQTKLTADDRAHWRYPIFL